jgi:hypothetical protein
MSNSGPRSSVGDAGHPGGEDKSALGVCFLFGPLAPNLSAVTGSSLDSPLEETGFEP